MILKHWQTHHLKMLAELQSNHQLPLQKRSAKYPPPAVEAVKRVVSARLELFNSSRGLTPVSGAGSAPWVQGLALLLDRYYNAYSFLGPG